MSDQRHKYDYPLRPDSAAAKIIEMVGPGRTVLELGSGPGSITRHLHAAGCSVTALELDDSAIEVVSQFCSRVHRCDLNDPGWPEVLSGEGSFPIVVAGDVLEHLYDPWGTVRRVLPLVAEDGYVVVSLPHIGHSAVLACILNADFDYQPWGLLDKTHLRFWGIRNIQRLFDEAGFCIVEAAFIVRSPEQTEFAQAWRRLPRELRKGLEWNRFGNVYQVVVKAVPARAGRHGLRLESIPVPSPSSIGYSSGARGNRLLGFLLSFIGLRNRERIARVLRRMGIGR